MNNDIKILVAEDSLTQAVKLQFILQKNGYKVSLARNGREALEKVREEKPDIVVTDIVMPEMDGYELCRHIKFDEILKNTPVILLTTLSDPKDIIRGLECRADNFITKPYREEFLLARINYILVNMELRKTLPEKPDIVISFMGQTYVISSDRMQIIDLLLSTYENAINKNQELEEANRELIRMKSELEDRNKELNRLNEDKNRLLGMAAHDLRNPIGAIMSYSEFLLEEDKIKADETYADFIGTIRESSEFLLHMVNELLDISIIESGNLKLTLSDVDFISFVKRNITINSVLSEKKGINILFNHDSDIPHVKIDIHKMEQVFNNLISNAVKFSYPGSKIEILIRKHMEELVVSVKDEGKGIPEREFSRLFKPFSRTSVQATGDEASTGLGLAIVKKIVEGHGGKIWVESIVDKGSTFYFSLPVMAVSDSCEKI
ncbi:MAG: hybrid sensor histidine kinase/response regulator [Candidatus Eremiobacterota bacterium]